MVRRPAPPQPIHPSLPGPESVKAVPVAESPESEVAPKAVESYKLESTAFESVPILPERPQPGGSLNAQHAFLLLDGSNIAYLRT